MTYQRFFLDLGIFDRFTRLATQLVIITRFFEISIPHVKSDELFGFFVPILMANGNVFCFGMLRGITKVDYGVTLLGFDIAQILLYLYSIKVNFDAFHSQR